MISFFLILLQVRPSLCFDIEKKKFVLAANAVVV